MQEMATRDAYGKALEELGHKFGNVVVLDADLSKSTKTEVFAKSFPRRFFNMGIAEQNMMAVAAGLATCGKVVYASSFAIFATGRAFEQIRNSVAYANLNVKICASHAGVTVGEDGGSHQTVEDIALMRVLPNMRVVVPADAVSTKKAVHAIYEKEGPFYLRLGRAKVPVIYGEDVDFEIGKAIKLREGPDVTIVACGIMVHESLKAAEMLDKKGIKATVIDMHTVKPLDEEALLKAVKITGCVVTAEEHSIIGGLGGAVVESLSRHFPVPVEMVGIDDKFGQSGSPQELLELYGLTAQRIAEKAEKSMARKAIK